MVCWPLDRLNLIALKINLFVFRPVRSIKMEPQHECNKCPMKFKISARLYKNLHKNSPV